MRKVQNFKLESGHSSSVKQVQICKKIKFWVKSALIDKQFLNNLKRDHRGLLQAASHLSGSGLLVDRHERIVELKVVLRASHGLLVHLAALEEKAVRGQKCLVEVVLPDRHLLPKCVCQLGSLGHRFGDDEKAAALEAAGDLSKITLPALHVQVAQGPPADDEIKVSVLGLPLLGGQGLGRSDSLHAQSLDRRRCSSHHLRGGVEESGLLDLLPDRLDYWEVTTAASHGLYAALDHPVGVLITLLPNVPQLLLQDAALLLADYIQERRGQDHELKKLKKGQLFCARHPLRARLNTI